MQLGNVRPLWMNFAASERFCVRPVGRAASILSYCSYMTFIMRETSHPSPDTTGGTFYQRRQQHEKRDLPPPRPESTYDPIAAAHNFSSSLHKDSRHHDGGFFSTTITTYLFVLRPRCCCCAVAPGAVAEVAVRCCCWCCRLRPPLGVPKAFPLLLRRVCVFALGKFVIWKKVPLLLPLCY